MQRASSVNGSGGASQEALFLKNQARSEQPQYPEHMSSHGPPSSTTYNAPEEPLRNAAQQYQTSIENLKKDDWQKIFDSLNVIKRIAMFHKDLLSASQGPQQKECFKLVVKQTENLRSQVSKNACMTLMVMF